MNPYSHRIRSSGCGRPGPEDGGSRDTSGCYNHIIDAFLQSIEYRARFGC